jgi:hypothetical protein
MVLNFWDVPDPILMYPIGDDVNTAWSFQVSTWPTIGDYDLQSSNAVEEQHKNFTGRISQRHRPDRARRNLL